MDQTRQIVRRIVTGRIAEAKMRVDPDAVWTYMRDETPIVGNPEHEKIVPQARRVLRKFFAEHPAAAARWTFTLIRAYKASWDETAFDFRLEPRGGQRRTIPRYSPEVEQEMLDSGISPERLQDEAKVYRDVKDVTDDVTNDPNLAYRGFSFEGWLDAREKGHVESTGEYNLGDQEGTYWGSDFETGRFYASSFAPFPVHPTRRRPGVIVSRSREGMLDHNDDPERISESELVSMEPTPLDELVNVWFIVPRSEGFGSQQLVWNELKDTIRKGSAAPSHVDLALLKIK
jgi:hypothetical protein